MLRTLSLPSLEHPGVLRAGWGCMATQGRAQRKLSKRKDVKGRQAGSIRSVLARVVYLSTSLSLSLSFPTLPSSVILFVASHIFAHTSTLRFGISLAVSIQGIVEANSSCFRQRTPSMSQLSLNRLVEYKMQSTIVLSPSTESHKPHPKPQPDPPVPVPDNPDDRRNP